MIYNINKETEMVIAMELVLTTGLAILVLATFL
jgi:hypothetical protein